MKKSAIGLAAAILSTAAVAQSSVTMFGILDVGLGIGRGSISNKTQMGTSSFNASRFGVRGTEDLGGGLKAGFWLEGSVNGDSGVGAATNTNNQAGGRTTNSGFLFNRRSTVSLMGNWGEIRLGRDLTPGFTVRTNEPFSANGMPATLNLLGAIAAGAPYSTVGGSNSPAVRASNSFSYITPNMSGFYGHFMHFLGENNSGAANSKDGTGNSLKLGYAAGPVKAELGWQRTRYAAPGDITTTNVGGSYDFGMLKAFAVYSHDKVDGPAADGKGWTVGALVPVGAGEVRAAFGNYELNSVARPEQKKFAVSYAHHLSKRTAVYTTYARVGNKGGSAMSLYGSVTAPNASSSGFDVGIRHSF